MRPPDLSYDLGGEAEYEKNEDDKWDRKEKKRKEKKRKELEGAPPSR